jgi:hypothetical protein
MNIDISINGIICISDRLPNGDLFKRKYISYSKTAAIREFKTDISLKLCNNFFNVLASDIRATFFNGVPHSTDNKNYHRTSYTIELFNNGCLTYPDLINRLSKSCKSDFSTIENIVEKYITFGG